MIIGIIGNLGTGKTLLMTLFGYYLQMHGYNVYANYELLFPYIPITDMNILGDMSKDSRNAMLLDEIWISADSRQAMSDRNILLSRVIAQSRKRKCEVFYTAQWVSQVESRIKTLTSVLLHPKIFIADDEGIPAILSVDVYYREIMGDLDYIKTTYVPTYGIEQLYSSEQVIKPSQEKRLQKISEEYIKDNYNVKTTKGELVSILTIEKNLSKADAHLVADYIAIRMRNRKKRKKKGKKSR